MQASIQHSLGNSAMSTTDIRSHFGLKALIIDCGGNIGSLGGVLLPRVWSAALFLNALFRVRVKKHAALLALLGCLAYLGWIVSCRSPCRWSSAWKRRGTAGTVLALSASVCL